MSQMTSPGQIVTRCWNNRARPLRPPLGQRFRASRPLDLPPLDLRPVVLGPLVLMLLFLFTADVRAQEEPSPERTPGAARPPMNFSLAQGSGATPFTQWIVASGRIVPETPAAFETFRKANRIDGLPIALDSRGGNVAAAIKLARQWRQLGLTTLVGRTVARGRAGSEARDHLVMAAAECYSSCVLLLMGGSSRRVAGNARVGVHQFGYSSAGEEIKQRTWTGVDFAHAQRLSAEIAVFHQEMDIDLKLLRLASSVPFRAPIRILTQEEIKGFRLASIVRPNNDGPAAVEWSLGTQDEPLLYRFWTVVDSPERRLDIEARLQCSPYSGFHRLELRHILAKSPGKGLSIDLIRLKAGEQDFLLRPPPNALQIKPPAGSAWMRREIPASLFQEAARLKALSAEVNGQGTEKTLRLWDESFAESFVRFEKLCDRKGPRFIGPNPRR